MRSGIKGGFAKLLKSSPKSPPEEKSMSRSASEEKKSVTRAAADDKKTMTRGAADDTHTPPVAPPDAVTAALRKSPAKELEAEKG